MKVVLELEDNIHLTREYGEDNDSSSNNLCSSKISLTTPLNTFQVEPINWNAEDTAVILDMVSRLSLDVILEFSGDVGSTSTLKLTLKSQLFTEFVDKFISNFTIAGLMRLSYQNSGEPYERMITIDTYGFQEFQEGDAYTFPDVKYAFNIIIQDAFQNAPSSIKMKLWISTKDPDKFEINRKILTEGIATDVTIIASNDAHIKCHKSFLIAHSSMFEAMLSSGMKEEITSVIEMKTVSEPVVKSLLAYLYCWDLTEASNNCEMAVELLKVADCYIIPRLNREISSILFSKPGEWFGVDGALELFLLSNRLGRAHLKLTALQALQMKFDELKTNRGYLELSRNDPAIAMELCNAALSIKPMAKNENKLGSKWERNQN